MTWKGKGTSGYSGSNEELRVRRELSAHTVCDWPVCDAASVCMETADEFEGKPDWILRCGEDGTAKISAIPEEYHQKGVCGFEFDVDCCRQISRRFEANTKKLTLYHSLETPQSRNADFRILSMVTLTDASLCRMCFHAHTVLALR